ncbi:MAG: type II toxin-antitoxin system VapC family toxin [Spirochaetota bacterium]
MIGYFDSSVLLSILLDEATKAEADSWWAGSEVRVSSILLKIETITILRRTWDRYRERLDSQWLLRKTRELEEFLSEVNLRIVDEEIERIIFLRKDLSRCRSLDAIHMATAMEWARILPDEDVLLYTYDKNLNALARLMKMATNPL